MKKLRTLYLIAAEDGFKLLQTHDLGVAEPALVEIDHKTADNFSDVAYSYPSEQGRNHAGTGSQGFENGNSGNKVEQERIRFSRHIVAALQAEWAKGTHDRIVISAGPKLLGELRDALPKALHAHVAAEMHKDLMKIPLHDLPPHFSEVSEA